MMRRFLHLIENPDGSECCVWQELKDSEVNFSLTRTDIHCLYADFAFAPDHCQDSNDVRFLAGEPE